MKENMSKMTMLFSSKALTKKYHCDIIAMTVIMLIWLICAPNITVFGLQISYVGSIIG